MHTGRSRNDQVILDVRMKLRDDIIDICELIINVIKSLIGKSKEHTNTIISLIYSFTTSPNRNGFSLSFIIFF